MSLRQKVDRLRLRRLRRPSGNVRTEAWVEHEPDTFRCDTLPGETRTLAELEAIDDEDLFLLILTHAPEPEWT